MTRLHMTASGAVSTSDGKVIPSSTRPDGSVRPQRRVKPGFEAVEDRAKYVPKQKLDSLFNGLSLKEKSTAGKEKIDAEESEIESAPESTETKPDEASEKYVSRWAATSKSIPLKGKR